MKPITVGFERQAESAADFVYYIDSGDFKGTRLGVMTMRNKYQFTPFPLWQKVCGFNDINAAEHYVMALAYEYVATMIETRTVPGIDL